MFSFFGNRGVVTVYSLGDIETRDVIWDRR